MGGEKDSSDACVKGSSLVSNTNGNQVISVLQNKLKLPFLEFTKSNDDWLNEISAEISYNGHRAYSIEEETLPGIDHPTLKQMLDYRDFDSAKTNLFVTGVETNRCVMKGSVHATLHGY